MGRHELLLDDDISSKIKTMQRQGFVLNRWIDLVFRKQFMNIESIQAMIDESNKTIDEHQKRIAQLVEEVKHLKLTGLDYARQRELDERETYLQSLRDRLKKGESVLKLYDQYQESWGDVALADFERLLKPMEARTD